jgi:hypothetical protein
MRNGNAFESEVENAGQKVEFTARTRDASYKVGIPIARIATAELAIPTAGKCFYLS